MEPSEDHASAPSPKEPWHALQELALALQSPRAATRRLVLDAATGALSYYSARPAAAQGNAGLLLSLLTHTLGDRDASLRAKALGCLEKNIAALVGAPTAIAPQTAAGAAAAATVQPQAVASALAARCGMRLFEPAACR